MKILKICLIACSIGMFATSCRNAECDTDANATTATAPATATPADGTQVAMEPADTAASASQAAMNNGNGSGDNARESTAGTQGKRTPGKVYLPAQKATTAKSDGPDLKASKKREGNFTNGTGSDNPGR